MEGYQRKEKIILEILEQTQEKEHFHQDIELLYLLSGKLDVTIDDQHIILKEEDVLMVNANRKHALQSFGEVMYVKLTIMYDLFSDILNDFDMIFVCDSSSSTDAAFDGLRKLLQQLLGRYLSNKGKVSDFAYISFCYQIMDYLSSHFLIRASDFAEKEDSDKYELRIHQIDNYIHANYRSAISIKDLSEKLYLSTGYLSRFFKKNYGMSFAEYLTNIRLRHAMEQLIYTDTPITRIVYDTGFANVAIFNKAFKNEYGETPSAVRKKALQTKKTDEPVLSGEMEKKLENVLWKEMGSQSQEHAGEIKAEHTVLQPQPLERIWSKVINIGSAEELLHSEVQEHIVLLKEMLDFAYVRFWNPFCKELFIDIDNPEHKYNFSRLDSILDFLIRNDIRPFIELESKPRRVDKTATTSLIFELFEHMASLENWYHVLEAFMKHAVARYGREEVSRWIFELWFDADKIRDDIQILNYSEKMKHALQIVHKYADAKLGGCGMHVYAKGDEKKSSYIRAFHKKMQSSGAAPDYLSIYCYAYDSQMENGKFLSGPSSDDEFVSHAVDNLQRDLADMRFQKDIYLTEWNLTFSDRNVINDTCFKAAYLMKNYIALTGRVACMAYFRGTDRVSEFYDTDDMLFGGTGLLTKNGIGKPMLFTFQFLNRLYSEYVGKGTNYLVSGDGHGNYGIVCHNCKKLNYNYYYVEEDRLDRDHLSKYYEDLDPLTLSLTLTDVEDGVYQMKIYRVNEENGSVQKIWREMEYETNLSRDDLVYVRRGCQPKLMMQKISVKEGTLPVQITMVANEIAYISLNRIS